MSDRLTRFKEHLQYKLENAIEHVASLAKHIKRATPDKVQRLCNEMLELEQEITDLRNALHYIADFEVEAAEDGPQAN